MHYLVKGADPDDFETIHATIPAQPGTYICRVMKSGRLWKEPVILWGIVSNGTPEPISMDGVWAGGDQDKAFVLFPDGKCARFEQSWDTEIEAIADLRDKVAD